MDRSPRCLGGTQLRIRTLVVGAVAALVAGSACAPAKDAAPEPTTAPEEHVDLGRWEPATASLGTSRIWPGPDTTVTGTLEDATARFARDVLEDDRPGQLSGAGPTEPNWVTYGDETGTRSAVLFIPRPGDSWVVVQIGDGTTSITATADTISFSVPDSSDPARSFVLAGTPRGTYRLTLTADDLERGSVSVPAGLSIASAVAVFKTTADALLTAHGTYLG